MRASSRHQVRQPMWPYRLNRESRHANGLINWWTWPFGGRGAGIDLITGRRATPNNTPTRYGPYAKHYNGVDPVVPGVWNIGTFYDRLGGNEHHNQAAPDAPYLGELTILAWAMVIDNGFSFLVSKGDVANDNAFEMRLSVSAGSALIETIRANSTYHAWQSSQFAGINYIHHWGAGFPADISTATRFYLNGVAADGADLGGSGTGAPTGNGADILIGARSDFFQAFYGMIWDLRIYRRKLSDGEVKDQFMHPWDLYANDAEVISNIPGIIQNGGAYGGSFPIGRKV